MKPFSAAALLAFVTILSGCYRSHTEDPASTDGDAIDELRDPIA